MEVYSILNFKGGTGKSTVCETLGYFLARCGKRVLVIDGDRQRNCTATLLGGTLVSPTLKEVIEGASQLEDAIQASHYADEVRDEVYEDRVRERLFVVPSHHDLEKASVYLSANRKAFYVVRQALRRLEHDFDVVLIDHAGSYSPVMEALLLASKGIFVPCQLEPYCVRGIFDMHAKLEGELPDHALENCGIIPYATNWSKSMTKLYLEQLQEEFGDLVLSCISTDANIPKAQSVYETIFEYDPTSRAAKDFEALGSVVLQRVDGEVQSGR